MEIPLDIQAKWRRNLFLLCCLFTVIGGVLEVVIYLIDSSTKVLFLPLDLYRFRFIYLPTFLNLAMVGVTRLCLRSNKLTNTAKNRWSCALIWFLCANTQLIHYVYGPLLSLPCLAIFVSVLYVDKKLTLCVTAASCATVIASGLFAAAELRKGDAQLLSDVALALVVLIVSYIGARLMIKYVRQQIDYILSNVEQKNELLEKLQVDGLMGIYNRVKMESVIETLIAKNEEVPMCLMMIDMDGFKEINDRYGHLSGDEVLVRLADLIRRFGAKNIIPCRYGGDEIVILLKEYTLSQALRFANGLRRTFCEQSYSFSPVGVISFSYGLAVYQRGMTRDEWLKQADTDLYIAKSKTKKPLPA